MRCASIGFLLLSLCAASLSGQGSRPVPTTPTPVPNIPRPVPETNSVTRSETLPPIRLEDEWAKALINRDARMFDRLLAPNFVYTENASVMSRDDVIKSVTGSDRVESARNEAMRVHDFGDVQVITGVLRLSGKGRQGSFDRRYRFTDTWQRRNGRWQIIAAQDYLIPR
jgi:ketosteroid isomerase-like protein